MKKKFLFLSLILLVSICCLFAIDSASVSASGIVITFDYNTDRPKSYLPSSFVSNLTTEEITIDEPSTVHEPISVSTGLLRYYSYVWTVNDKAIDLDTYVFTKSTYVKAKWTPIEYTIYYNYITNAEKLQITNFIDHENYSIEKSVTYYRPEREGYYFVDWYTSAKFLDSQIQMFTEQYSLGDKYVYARFEPIAYMIDYHTDASNIDNPTMYTIESPTYILSDPILEGHIFEGWYLDEYFSHPFTQIAKGSMGNLNLYPKWSLETYIVTYVLPNNEMQQVSVEYGQKAKSPDFKKSILEVFRYDQSINNVTEDMTVSVRLVNIWYVYLIALVLFVCIIFLIVWCSKNKYNKMHKLRYVYQSNIKRNKRKY